MHLHLSFFHKILNLTLSDEPILALGVYFSHDEKKAEQKPSSTSRVLWKKFLIYCQETLYGRINVVKTHISFSDKVNKIISDYIWKYKQPKIKKLTIMKSKEEGRLKMTD